MTVHRDSRVTGTSSDARGFLRTFAISAIASVVILGGMTPASADIKYSVGATQPANVVRHHDTPRYNTHQYNRVRINFLSYNGNGTLSAGIRNTAGTQIARAPLSNGGAPRYNQWLVFTKPNGSMTMPGGTFYLNSLGTSSCGNSSCTVPPVTWNSNLEWNIALPGEVYP